MLDAEFKTAGAAVLEDAVGVPCTYLHTQGGSGQPLQLGDGDGVHQQADLQYSPTTLGLAPSFRQNRALARLLGIRELRGFCGKAIGHVMKDGAVTRVEPQAAGSLVGLAKKVQEPSLGMDLGAFIAAVSARSSGAGTNSNVEGSGSGSNNSTAAASPPPVPLYTITSFSDAASASYLELEGVHHGNSSAQLRLEAELLVDIINDYLRQRLPFECFVVENWDLFESMVMNRL